jgi:hypothetical protein
VKIDFHMKKRSRETGVSSQTCFSPTDSRTYESHFLVFVSGSLISSHFPGAHRSKFAENEGSDTSSRAGNAPCLTGSGVSQRRGRTRARGYTDPCILTTLDTGTYACSFFGELAFPCTKTPGKPRFLQKFDGDGLKIEAFPDMSNENGQKSRKFQKKACRAAPNGFVVPSNGFVVPPNGFVVPPSGGQLPPNGFVGSGASAVGASAVAASGVPSGGG